MNANRILVVDDDPRITGLLRVILEKSGNYEVREENRSFAALASAREFRPHLIVMDVDMPGKTGGDVAREVAQDPVVGATPVVFLTSLVSAAETGGEAIMRRGVPFLAKPVDPKALLRTVETLITVRAAETPTHGRQ